MIQKITPFLWFDSNAEEAAEYYISVFPNSRITHRSYYTEAGFDHHGKTAGTLMVIAFELQGQAFSAINGGPLFQLSEATSFAIHCDTQEEIDHYWDRLSDGGDPQCQNCGWLKDRFGLSWQIIPSILPSLMVDPAKAERVMSAVLTMSKIDLPLLLEAANDSSR